VTPRTGISLLAALALLVAGGAEAASTLKLKTAFNETLDRRIVVTTKGRTLYVLRAEQDGYFLCTGPCLRTWPPLILQQGAKPVGVRRLGVVKRPDGRRQVTYKGRPVYRFAGDAAKGDVNGEGVVDVGTWRAARAPKPRS
jgi:predicted lipoprotein with Yx(FWY)xxD motif